MLVLFINGSPRRSGTVAGMLEVVRREAESRGAETVWADAGGLSVAPCRGCMACRTRGECVLPADDAQRVLSLMRRADAIVVGAPCYWGNMPGQLKVLFDRMVYGMMGESRGGLPRPLHRGKRALVVVACTTPWPFNIIFRQSAGTVRALREILRWSGFRIVGTVQRGGTKTRRGIDERCEKRLARLAARLLKG